MWIHRCCLCSVFVVTLSKFWQFGSIPVDIAFPNFILPSYFSGIYYTISVGKKNSSGINVLTWVCYTCQRNFNHQILSLVIHFYCIEYLWRSLTSNTTKGSKLRDWTFYKTQTLYLTIPLIFHACVEYHVFSEVCDPYTDFFFSQQSIPHPQFLAGIVRHHCPKEFYLCPSVVCLPKLHLD